MHICRNCVLTENYPNIDFDESGICNYCRQQNKDGMAKFKARQSELLLDTISSQRGLYEYDALCCYSGGKDSTHLLMEMRRTHDLKVLAFTLDNGFIAPEAKENIQRVVVALDVEHIYIRPSISFLSKLMRGAILGGLHDPAVPYRYRISDVCLACITLVNIQATRIALQKRIPMIFAGFTAGQIPRAVMKNHYLKYRESFSEQRERLETVLGKRDAMHFDIPEADFDIFQLSPSMLIERSESQQLEDIAKLGWRRPSGVDGCSSNCSLNGVGNIVHEKKYGFHPYSGELSMLVREGIISRDEALSKLNETITHKDFVRMLSYLDLTEADIEKLQG